jgi:hypothetical protein
MRTFAWLFGHRDTPKTLSTMDIDAADRVLRDVDQYK